MGDMDFKIAGTKTGITALQVDIKIPGLPLKIVMETLNQASKAKSHIRVIMHEVIQEPRALKKHNMPVTQTLEVPIHKRGKFLGIAGVNLKKILFETGVQVNHIYFYLLNRILI